MAEDYGYTIYNQYANSTKLLDVIMSFAQASSLDNFTDEFIDKIWNIMTCNSYGLDIWGKKIGIKRFVIPVIPENTIFGFYEAQDYNPAILNYPKPFNEAPFYDEDTMTSKVIGLNDEQYRALILAKAFTNLSIATLPEINKFLRILFLNRPTIHAYDTRDFEIIVKTPYIDRFELSILFNSPEAVPVSSGVRIRVDITDTPGGGIPLEKVIFVPDVLVISEDEEKGIAIYSLIPYNTTDDYIINVPDINKQDVIIDKNKQTITVSRNPLTPSNYNITVTNATSGKQVGNLAIIFDSYIIAESVIFNPTSLVVAPGISISKAIYEVSPSNATELLDFKIPDANLAYVNINKITKTIIVTRNNAAPVYSIEVYGISTGKLLGTLAVNFLEEKNIKTITFTPEKIDVPVGTDKAEITYSIMPEDTNEDYIFSFPIVNQGDITIDKINKKLTVIRNNDYPEYTITAIGTRTHNTVGSLPVKFELPDYLIGIVFTPDAIEVPFGTDTTEATYILYPDNSKEDYTFVIPDANKPDVVIDKINKKLTFTRNNKFPQYTINVTGNMSGKDLGSLPVNFVLPIVITSIIFNPDTVNAPVGTDSVIVTYTIAPDNAEEGYTFVIPDNNKNDVTIDKDTKTLTIVRNDTYPEYDIEVSGDVSGNTVGKIHIKFEQNSTFSTDTSIYDTIPKKKSKQQKAKKDDCVLQCHNKKLYNIFHKKYISVS